MQRKNNELGLITMNSKDFRNIREAKKLLKEAEIKKAQSIEYLAVDVVNAFNALEGVEFSAQGVNPRVQGKLEGRIDNLKKSMAKLLLGVASEHRKNFTDPTKLEANSPEGRRNLKNSAEYMLGIADELEAQAKKL